MIFFQERTKSKKKDVTTEDQLLADMDFYKDVYNLEENFYYYRRC